LNSFSLFSFSGALVFKLPNMSTSRSGTSRQRDFYRTQLFGWNHQMMCRSVKQRVRRAVRPDTSPNTLSVKQYFSE
jgi:hypothetical protein